MNSNYLTIEDFRRLLLCSKETLTLKEFSEYSGLSINTVYKLTSQRKISYSCPNGKVIFISRADATKFLQSNRVPSATEIDQAAATYVTLNPGQKGGAL